MQSTQSQILENRSKANEPNDVIEIRYIPLPEEQREAYLAAMRILARMLIEIGDEE